MGLMEKRVEATAQQFKPYTPRERQLLALKYTPEQLKAIEAGEASIDPKDIVTQGRKRVDYFSLHYQDDFSKIRPLMDNPVRAPDQDIDPDIKALSDDETTARFAKWTEELGRQGEEFESRQRAYANDEAKRKDVEQKSIETGIGPNDGLTPQQRNERMRKLAEYVEGPDVTASFEKYMGNPENFFYSPKGTLNSQADYVAPNIPKFKSPGLSYRSEEIDPNMERLQKQTGMTQEEIRRIRTKVLVSHRVVNQTRMGKIQSQYFLAIAGNQNGMLGVGEGKSAEPEDARRQAVMASIRAMKPIPRYEERTIYGDVEAKVAASVVQLSARPPGR